ncbi:MaoC family dehydratase [Natrarchaeobius sp. A-rgal3]|uniref:MaoC family dehydratase n=1 Tax=Natrarchaeobius versutus TaxID=1679078 RepID=UPI00350EA670
MRHYGDITVGETEEYGAYEVTKDEIIEFGRKYDPQPFHTDEEAARNSYFGELVASGWHTASICMRLSVEMKQREGHEPENNLAGAGVDELRWHEPVKPGDVLRIRREVVDKRPVESETAGGYIDARIEGINQNDDVVISYVGKSLHGKR